MTIHSAHIATHGERAVDTFYLTDLTGDKLAPASRVRALEARLLAAQLAPMDAAMNASTKMKVGYFTQYQVEELDADDTPLEMALRMSAARAGPSPSR